MSVIDLLADSGRSIISVLLTSRVLAWLSRDESRTMSIHCRYLNGKTVWMLTLYRDCGPQWDGHDGTEVYQGASDSIEILLTAVNRLLMSPEHRRG